MGEPLPGTSSTVDSPFQVDESEVSTPREEPSPFTVEVPAPGASQTSPFATSSGAPVSPGSTDASASPFQTEAPAEPVDQTQTGGTTSPFTVEAQSPDMPWLTSYNEALSAGARQGKSILLFFNDPGQYQSQQMDTIVYSDPNVVALMKDFILCRVRLGENPALDAHYQVPQAPSVYFLTSGGVSQARAVGFISPTNMASALEQFK
jgi:hypothetical protein